MLRRKQKHRILFTGLAKDGVPQQRKGARLPAVPQCTSPHRAAVSSPAKLHVHIFSPSHDIYGLPLQQRHSRGSARQRFSSEGIIRRVLHDTGSRCRLVFFVERDGVAMRLQQSSALVYN